MRALTWATLLGLLAATGLRLGEALALDRDDVDLRAGVLAIRRTKFGKSRFVPVHESTRRALQRYTRGRDLRLPRPSTAAFFVAERGKTLEALGGSAAWLTRDAVRQGPRDTGAGGSGWPPGPAAKVSGEMASCWPTPGLLQSHTPPGKAAFSRASCAGLNVTGP